MSLKSWLQQLRYQRFIRQSPYRKVLSELPPSLLPHWQAHAKDEFTGIPDDAIFFIRAAEGLMMFFDCVKQSGQCGNASCALPSKAADSVWHAWLDLPQARFTEVDVDNFCRKHFGRTIPHMPAAQMDAEAKGSMAVALATSLVQLRHIEGKDALSHTAPALFTLDKRLKMPRGYSYSMAGDKLGFQNMSLLGQGTGATLFPAAFMPMELLAIGLISAPMLEHYQRKQAALMAAQNNDISSSSDFGSASSSTSNYTDCSPGNRADGGSSDSCSDSGSNSGSSSDSSSSGSSCGSSCSSS
ncbi:hypothetical protein [Undibacterium sp. Di24W]|uniref:hypothetical protein n=1 Tax=Undibacterium sp. Di24W TaxID=3413033 RepID=UPI003BF2BB78